MKQATFASLAFEQKKKQTRRERFLTEMDAVVAYLQILGRLTDAAQKQTAAAEK